MKSKKSKILFLVQLPPPVHGVSMMNQITVNNPGMLDYFRTNTVLLNYTSEIKGIGKFTFKKLFSFFRIYRNILKLIFSFKPDLIYFTLTPTGISFYRDAIIVFLLKRTKAKIVYHLHGKGIYNKTKHSKINRTIYKLVLRNTYIIHLSESLKEDIFFVNDKVKSYIVPNGINSTLYKKGGNHKISEKRNLLFLSNLAENKGVIMFLNACKFLKTQGVSFSANIVGRETTLISKKEIEGLITKLDLDNEIDYLGPKYNIEKEVVLANSDIFVFPTYNDCFPLVLLEALKYGLPVISTNEGAIGEIIDNNKNGFIINRKDQECLNRKLKELVLDDEKIKLFSKNAKEKFSKYYTTKSYEDNMLSVLKEIIND